MVNLKIDDKSLTVEPGTTILQAARLAGVKIPTLCHHPLLEPYAACRVCVVEVVHKGQSGLFTSVQHQSRRGDGRQDGFCTGHPGEWFNVEMLLARAPAAEPLREIAGRWG